MGTPLRVLVVEDSEDDALLLKRQLEQDGYAPELERVESAAAFTAAVARQEWDVIIADYSMPHFSGLEALRLLNETGRDIPFIIVSGTIGEEMAVAAMKAGAHDYVRKENLSRLIPAIEREVREAAGRRARRRAEEALRAAEEEKKEFYREVVQAVTGGRLMLHEHGDPELQCRGESIEVNEPSDIRGVRQRVRAVAGELAMAPERIDDLELAVAEAAANAWKHAGSGRVCLDNAGGILRAVIADQGHGIAPHQLARAAFEKGYSTAHTLGAGFALMLTLADKVRLATGPQGTTVVLEMAVQPAAAPADAWASWSQLAV